MRYAHTKGGFIKIFYYYLFHFIRFILNQKIIDIKTCRLRKRNVHYLTFLDLCNLQQLLVERPVSLLQLTTSILACKQVNSRSDVIYLFCFFDSIFLCAEKTMSFSKSASRVQLTRGLRISLAMEQKVCLVRWLRSKYLSRNIQRIAAIFFRPTTKKARY